MSGLEFNTCSRGIILWPEPWAGAIVCVFYTYIATFIGCQALCGTEFDANLADTQPQGGFTSEVLQIIVNMFCVFYFVAVGNCVWRVLFIVLSCLCGGWGN